MDTRIVYVPQFRTLILRIPLVELITEREDTFLCARLLFIATGATESRIEFVFIQCVQQRLCLHQVRMHFTAMRKRSYTCFKSFHIALYNQVPAVLPGILVTELNHLLELPLRVDMHQRERNLTRSKSLFGQTYHNR
jgi:hypothetical protein